MPEYDCKNQCHEKSGEGQHLNEEGEARTGPNTMMGPIIPRTMLVTAILLVVGAGALLSGGRGGGSIR